MQTASGRPRLWQTKWGCAPYRVLTGKLNFRNARVVGCAKARTLMFTKSRNLERAPCARGSASQPLSAWARAREIPGRGRGQVLHDRSYLGARLCPLYMGRSSLQAQDLSRRKISDSRVSSCGVRFVSGLAGLRARRTNTNTPIKRIPMGVSHKIAVCAENRGRSSTNSP